MKCFSGKMFEAQNTFSKLMENLKSLVGIIILARCMRHVLSASHAKPLSACVSEVKAIYPFRLIVADEALCIANAGVPGIVYRPQARHNLCMWQSYRLRNGCQMSFFCRKFVAGISDSFSDFSQ